MIRSSRSLERAVSVACGAVLALALTTSASLAHSGDAHGHHHHEQASTTAAPPATPTGAQAAATNAAVTFACCQYNPSTVTINVGETVSWSGAFSSHPMKQVVGPTSNVPVAGGFANSTGTFYVTQFNTAGTFYYNCSFHGTGTAGMRGTVIVVTPADVASSNDIAGTSLAVEPNPTMKAAKVRFTLPRAMTVELALYDLSGALVRRLANGQRLAGEHQADWDGRDDSGRAANAGLYFVRLSADRPLKQLKLVKVR